MKPAGRLTTLLLFTVCMGRGETRGAYGRLPLVFEPNQGQAGADVRYIARGAGYTLLLTDTGATFAGRR